MHCIAAISVDLAKKWPSEVSLQEYGKCPHSVSMVSEASKTCATRLLFSTTRSMLLWSCAQEKQHDLNNAWTMSIEPTCNHLGDQKSGAQELRAWSWTFHARCGLWNAQDLYVHYLTSLQARRLPRHICRFQLSSIILAQTKRLTAWPGFTAGCTWVKPAHAFVRA
jgi:hypothetical protein